MILLIILFLFFFGFFGLEDFLPIFLAFYVLLFFKKNISKLFLVNFLFLFSFSLFYFLNSVFLQKEDVYTLIGKLVYPSLFLLLGYFSASQERIKVEYIVMVPALGLLLFAIISYFYSLVFYGSYVDILNRGEGRVVYSFWDNSPYAATLINGYLSIFISLFFFYMLKLNNKVDFNFNMFFSLMAVYVGFSLGNRTSILILLVSFLIFLFIVIKERVQIKWYYLISLVVFSSIFLMKNFSESILGKRGDELQVAEDPRLKAWGEGIDLLVHNFLGSMGQTSVGYAHNLWIDVGINAGFIPFLILIIFSLINLSMIVFLCISQGIKNIDYILIFSFSAFFITFMLEPIYQGLFKFFCLYCLFVGVFLRTFDKKVIL